jgi:hypothetical protein
VLKPADLKGNYCIGGGGGAQVRLAAGWQEKLYAKEH